MFSSNQILDITCEERDLADVIRFAVKFENEEMFLRQEAPVRMAYMEREGLYCIGRGSMPGHRNCPEGVKCPDDWSDYPFRYDPEIVAKIIAQWLKDQPKPKERYRTDGTERIGLRVRCVNSLYDTDKDLCEKIGNPWPCILTFAPFSIGYDK